MSCIITSIGSIPYGFLTDNPATRWLVYPTAAIQGVGIAMMLNTSTSLISDVIGSDSEASAFVYGIYSFVDKIVNGFMIYFLVADYSTNNTALRLIVTGIPVVCSFGTAILTWIGMSLYSDQMAKISAGSQIKTKKATIQSETPVQLTRTRGSLNKMDEVE